MPHYAPPQKKSGPSVFLILAIIGSVAFFGVAMLVGSGIYLLSKARSDSDTVKTVRGTGCPCSVEVPSNWTDLPPDDQNPTATIQKANLFGERYVLVMADPKADIASIFNVEEPTGEEVLKQFTEFNLEGVEESYAIRRISNRKLDVNGLPAIQHKFEAEIGGIDVLFWNTYVEGRDHFYQVQTWALASAEAQDEEKLLKITNSFKEN